MKKIILFTLISTFIHTASYAQLDIFHYGIKAGVNLASTGKITQINGTSVAEASEQGLGFHAGVFGQIDLPVIYIMPELIYTQTSSKYKNSSAEQDLDLKKIDLPVLVGFKALPFFNVFAGPVLQYALDADYKDESVETIKNDISLGLNAGVGFKFSKIGFTLRYETGLSENNISLVNKQTGQSLATLDSNSSQFIFSMMFFLDK